MITITNKLDHLALFYGTDKYPYYTPLYDRLLSPYRSSVKRVLEIGIGTVDAMPHVSGYKPGASLRMWRDYFPNALVYGMDVNEPVGFAEDRIWAFYGDQSNPEHLRKVGVLGPFDLIIDDGSHNPQDQLLAAQTLRPFLATDGLYIIEDVNPSSFEYLTTQLPHHYCVGADSVSNADAQARCILIF